MEGTQITLITIVTEYVLEPRLLRDLIQCGASGWTITQASGQGPRGRRISEVEGGNIRVEVLVPPDVATRIWEKLTDEYFASYAVAAWSSQVLVARPARYGQPQA